MKWVLRWEALFTEHKSLQIWGHFGLWLYLLSPSQYLYLFMCFVFYNFSNYRHHYSVERKKWCDKKRVYLEGIRLWESICKIKCLSLVLRSFMFLNSWVPFSTFFSNILINFCVLGIVQGSSHQRSFYFKPTRWFKIADLHFGHFPVSQ